MVLFFSSIFLLIPIVISFFFRTFEDGKRIIVMRYILKIDIYENKCHFFEPFKPLEFD